MNTITGRRWGDVKAVGDLCGMIEMFVQCINVFENAAAPADDEVVDCDDVLGVFRKGYATNMLPQRSVLYSNSKSSSSSSFVLERVL